MEDITYGEWSDHLDLAAASRGVPWLPAYGYAQQAFPDLFNRNDSPGTI